MLLPHEPFHCKFRLAVQDQFPKISASVVSGLLYDIILPSGWKYSWGVGDIKAEQRCLGRVTINAMAETNALSDCL